MRVGSTLEETRTVMVTPEAARAEDPAEPGDQIGRFVVLEEVGRGGMGRVMRAYDPKLQREVALKELHGYDHDVEAKARLVSEARAMAKLSHRNVVAVYDVEQTQTQRLVVVMEYVPGQTLQDWLQDAAHDWRAIVDAFIEAGRGLVAAHQVGLLHRDFKPSNVLVARDGSIKVTDFGLAKHARATDGVAMQMVGEDSDLTRAGDVLGTPIFMPPEQHRGQSLTPAADQYALCVSLWRALTGEAPFSLANLLESKAKGPPPWPVSSTPTAIVDAVRRGLAADPADRWPSVDELLDALVAEPARPRNRSVRVLSVLLGLSSGGLAWQLWADARATRCSGSAGRLAGIWDRSRRDDIEAAMVGTQVPYAETTWRRTRSALDRYAKQWAAMHRDVCEATTIRGEQSTAVMDQRMACLDRARHEFGAVVDTLAQGGEGVVARAHAVVAELDPIARCADVEVLASDADVPPPQHAAAVESARRGLEDVRVADAAGQFTRARQRLTQIEADLVDVDDLPVRAEWALWSGVVHDSEGAYDRAEEDLRRAIELGAGAQQWGLVGDAAKQLMLVVGVRRQRGAEALQYRELALGITRDRPASQAGIHANVGLVLASLGRYRDAEVEHRLALELYAGERTVSPLDRANARNNLATVLQSLGRWEEAEAELRDVLAVATEALGQEHPEVAGYRNNFANTLRAQHKLVEAEAEHRRVLAIRQSALGPGHPEVADSLNNLGGISFERGRFEAAEAEFRRAMALRIDALGQDHPAVAAVRTNIAAALQEQGRSEDAERELLAAIESQERSLGPDHPTVASARGNLGLILASQGRFEDAERQMRLALRGLVAALGEEHADVTALRSQSEEIRARLARTPR